MCSVIVAVVLGALVTLTREDPVYSAVIAWALWAVGSKAGWASLEVSWCDVRMIWFGNRWAVRRRVGPRINKPTFLF